MSLSPHTILDPKKPSAMFHGRCALAVMAKAPKAGHVKTRLSPPLDSHQAAALNIAFLRDTIACLKEAEAAGEATAVISYTPIGEEANFAGVVPDDVPLIPQRGEGFGERLQSTTDDLFAAGFSAVCLIDSDSPTVPMGAYVEAAGRLLTNEDCAVLGPSDDGGYYVIGVNASHPRLFEDIPWSTAVVAEQTRQRAQELDLPVYSLPTWFDVDDRQALARLYRELVLSDSVREGFAATYTRDYLRSIRDQLDKMSMAAISAQGTNR
jgi:rSAM/selenodomain-associated transferase 1